MKRYIYIIIGIIIVAAIAIMVILFIKDRSEAPPAITGTTGSLPTTGAQTNASGAQSTSSTTASLSLPSSNITNGSSQSAIGSFGILSNSPVLDYFVNASNTIIAVQPDGEVISIADGQTTNLSSSTTNDIISASFSYDGEKVLVSYGDPTNPQAVVFDLKTQEWTTLPAGLLSPQWSPNSYQIAYLSSPSAGQLSLAILNAADLKAGIATLLTLNANDLTLQWPTKTQFVLSDRPSADVNGSIWLFNSQSDTLTPIAYEETGAESIWSSGTSTLGLISSDDSSGQDPTLQLETATGGIAQQLSFATLPSKCVFNTAQAPTSTAATTSTAYLALYCGIPRSSSGFSSAQLPDAYNMMSLFTSDDIYTINTATGATQVLWDDQTQNMDTSDLKIFDGTLFFVNRYDQKLYGLVIQ